MLPPISQELDPTPRSETPRLDDVVSVPTASTCPAAIRVSPSERLQELQGVCCSRAPERYEAPFRRVLQSAPPGVTNAVSMDSTQHVFQGGVAWSPLSSDFQREGVPGAARRGGSQRDPWPPSGPWERLTRSNSGRRAEGDTRMTRPVRESIRCWLCSRYTGGWC